MGYNATKEPLIENLSLFIWEEVLEEIDRERKEDIEIWYEVIKEIEEEREQDIEIWSEVIKESDR